MDLNLKIQLATTVLQILVVIVGFAAAVYFAKKGFSETVDASNEQVRSNRISTHRQEWIDRLRLTVAEYISCLLLLTHHESRVENGPQSMLEIEQEDRAIVTESRVHWLQLRYKLELLINPDEEDHRELIKLLDQMWKSRRDLDFLESPIVKKVVDTCQAILKREWERVKAGEPAKMEQGAARRA